MYGHVLYKVSSSKYALGNGQLGPDGILLHPLLPISNRDPRTDADNQYRVFTVHFLARCGWSPLSRQQHLYIRLPLARLCFHRHRRRLTIAIATYRQSCRYRPCSNRTHAHGAHVAPLISDFCDPAVPQLWCLPHAWEKNLLSLLTRLLACGIAIDVDPYKWKYQCHLGFLSAVKHDKLEMVEWIHDCCPIVLPYQSMIEAAGTGNVRVLEWLAARHESVMWLPDMMNAAASTGQLQMLQWLQRQPTNTGCLQRSAVANWVQAACSNGHTELAKYFLEWPEGVDCCCDENMDWVAECDDLELVQWLFAKRKTVEFINFVTRWTVLQLAATFTLSNGFTNTSTRGAPEL